MSYSIGRVDAPPPGHILCARDHAPGPPAPWLAPGDTRMSLMLRANPDGLPVFWRGCLPETSTGLSEIRVQREIQQGDAAKTHSHTELRRGHRRLSSVGARLRCFMGFRPQEINMTEHILASPQGYCAISGRSAVPLVLSPHFCHDAAGAQRQPSREASAGGDNHTIAVERQVVVRRQ